MNFSADEYHAAVAEIAGMLLYYELPKDLGEELKTLHVIF